MTYKELGKKILELSDSELSQKVVVMVGDEYIPVVLVEKVSKLGENMYSDPEGESNELTTESDLDKETLEHMKLEFFKNQVILE